MSKQKEILKLNAQGFSQRRIAEMLHVSRNTVSKVLKSADQQNLVYEEVAPLSDLQIKEKLNGCENITPIQALPDFEMLHKELLKTGVTLKLLWEEYLDGCREAQQPSYQYSQFCKLYRDYVVKHRLTMHITHKPGEKIMVDWAGTPIFLKTSEDGRPIKTYLFVAVLPFSMYAYAKACLTMKEEDWINAHVQMYAYFGASTRLLVPDNLKTGILHHRKHEDPVINRAYQELAEHYHAAILPARVKAPKDKAAVEGTVGHLTNHIIGRLRNRQFFDLSSLNKAIATELDAFNRRPFQKKDGCRQSIFQEEERPFMQALPVYAYEYARWKQATVQFNYHIAIDYQNYSVPYEYVKKKVDLRYTKNMIEVFYQGLRICSHTRLYGRRGQYSTNPDHMPLNHQLYSEWDSARFLRWAEDIGPGTLRVIEGMQSSYKVPEQAYKGCLSLLKLTDHYSKVQLESACNMALEHLPSPRYKNINLILKEKHRTAQEDAPKQAAPSAHAFVRGGAYFGGPENE